MWPFLYGSWVAFDRPSNLWAVLPGVPRHWRFPRASGGHPPRLIPPSGGFIAWPLRNHQKGECRRGRRYFWPCHPPGFYTLRGEGLLPGALKRGMSTGPNVFLALLDACGLRPFDRTHLKNALCHIRALVGRIDK